MTPAVKRMQKAHRLFFAAGRTAFHNRAYKDFKETAAYRIEKHGYKDTDKTVIQHRRQE